MYCILWEKQGKLIKKQGMWEKQVIFPWKRISYLLGKSFTTLAPCHIEYLKTKNVETNKVCWEKQGMLRKTRYVRNPRLLIKDEEKYKVSNYQTMNVVLDILEHSGKVWLWSNWTKKTMGAFPLDLRITTSRWTTPSVAWYSYNLRIAMAQPAFIFLALSAHWRFPTAAAVPSFRRVSTNMIIQPYYYFSCVVNVTMFVSLISRDVRL